MVQQATDHVAESLPAYVSGTLDARAIEAVRLHLAGCPACRLALDEWELIGAALQAVGTATPMPARGLLDRAFARIDAAARRPRWHERWVPALLKQPVIARSLTGGLVAALLALIVTFTPVGSYAQGLLDVFQPRQFVIVPVTWADLRALPSLDQYGDLSQVSHGKPQHLPSAAGAAAASGMAVLTPATLPPSVTASPTYGVVPSHSATFTFSATKARQAATARGKHPPPMPASIDGSSIQMTTGTAVIAAYGGDPDFLSQAEARKPGTLGPARGPVGGHQSDHAALMADIAGAIPQLVVAQAFAPVATSSGASPRDLEQYLLSQPGISENLANAIRAIGDPTTTWPIPVPLGQVNTRPVSVQGVRGTLFADTSGFVTGVVWVKAGVIYAVGGPLSEGEVLGVANSLR